VGLELGRLPEIRLDRPRLLDALAKGARVDGGKAVELRLDLLEVAASIVVRRQPRSTAVAPPVR
jgi:hypothetical protein